MSEASFIAVDLGAGSGRVFLVGAGAGELSLEEIHRFYYPPRKKNGNLRWDFRSIFEEIKVGLRQAACRADEVGCSIKSIGVDSWAVDYGLLDEQGDLVDDPVCYRDDRTFGVMEKVFARVSRHAIFEKTGIQFQNFNTLFQLWSERRHLEKVSLLLLFPDLVNYFLTGQIAVEFTNATTTQMVDVSAGTWDKDLLDRVGIPASILPNIISTGTDIGTLRPEIEAEVCLTGTHVIATASHDTASAVAAAPLSPDSAYISSGTWSLIGIEADEPLISEEIERQNFTNEGGVFGTTRFLKNVMGLWIFESCRKEWKYQGLEIEYADMVSNVSGRTNYAALIYPDDPRFLNPTSMLDAIKQQLVETGQTIDEDPISIAKMIFDSLAFRYASVLRSIELLSGVKLKGVHVLGGGGRNWYLNQMTANASGLTIKAGLYEATVMGNAIVQTISAGRFESLSEARRYVTENVEFVEFVPQASQDLDFASARYAEIEDRFTSHANQKGL